MKRMNIARSVSRADLVLDKEMRCAALADWKFDVIQTRS